MRSVTTFYFEIPNKNVNLINKFETMLKELKIKNLAAQIKSEKDDFFNNYTGLIKGGADLDDEKVSQILSRKD